MNKELVDSSSQEHTLLGSIVLHLFLNTYQCLIIVCCYDNNITYKDTSSHNTLAIKILFVRMVTI